MSLWSHALEARKFRINALAERERSDVLSQVGDVILIVRTVRVPEIPKFVFSEYQVELSRVLTLICHLVNLPFANCQVELSREEFD